MNPFYENEFLKKMDILGEDSKPLRVFRAREKAVQHLETVIDKTLERMGVDITPDNTKRNWHLHNQLIRMNIVITELDYQGMMELCRLTNLAPSPKILGFYIYRDGEPEYFIPDPSPDSDGFVYYRVYNIKKDTLVTEEPGLTIL